MTMLPEQVSSLLHAYVSMQRIEEFLSEAEVPDWASSLKSNTSPDISDGKIGFRAASFRWDVAPKNEPSRFTLGPLNIEFPKGKLTLVIGPTGSGKSALLNALLGANLIGLEHATIKDNIIFGSRLGHDEARYQAVIEACTLTRDLETFDTGDLT
ncbi:hypothetical protein PHLCEN_2v13205, partial [Hermanssonia centrifuga]